MTVAAGIPSQFAGPGIIDRAAGNRLDEGLRHTVHQVVRMHAADAPGTDNPQGTAGDVRTQEELRSPGGPFAGSKIGVAFHDDAVYV